MLNFNQHLAEREEIAILPNFRLARTLRLLNNVRVGPFSPQTPALVPLWFALTLKKQNKCKIIVPEWLSPQALLAQRDAERESSMQEYAPLPHLRFREIAALLLQNAPEDFEDCDLVRSLVADVDNLRGVKIRAGLKRKALAPRNNGGDRVLNLTDLGALELIEFRPFLTTGMDMFAKLAKEEGRRNNYYGTGQEARGASSGAEAMVVGRAPIKKLRRFR